MTFKVKNKPKKSVAFYVNSKDYEPYDYRIEKGEIIIKYRKKKK